MTGEVTDKEAILKENADLINLVIYAVNFNSYLPALQSNLVAAESNGWTSLVSAIRQIVAGNYDISSYKELDQEDRVIISYIVSTLTTPDFLAKFLFHYSIQQCNQGHLKAAEETCRKAYKLAPSDADINSQLAFILQSQKKYDEAVSYYEAALKLRPGQPLIHLNLGAIQQEIKDYAAAQSNFILALEKDPGLVPAMEHLAYIYEKSYRLQDAQKIVERGLSLSPKNVSLNLVKSKLYQRDGRLEDAIKCLNTALETKEPHQLYGEIHSRLGYLYDRVDDINNAYHHFTAGNHYSKENFSRHNIDKNDFIKQVDHISDMVTRFESSKESNIPIENIDGAPVFLVGFPRSGTTLLNQVLDSHPSIQALEEKPSAFNMVMRFFELTKNMKNPLAEVNQNDISELRKIYFDTVDTYLERNQQSTFIDKFPLNIAYVPIIWRVFPEARFILALRHPCDACLSCFMHSFGVNTAMANFLTMADTVSLYEKLMSNWKVYSEKLSLNTYETKYEDLIENFRKEAGQILNFLEIEWDDQVLKHTDKARARGIIDTPSYDQVTQPIYKHASYRWVRYKEQLDPFIGTLDPYIECFSYSK